MIKTNKCIDCGKKICSVAKRCNSCNTRNFWKIHPEFRKEFNHCQDCGKKLTSSGNPKRCKKCYRIWQSIPENNLNFGNKGKEAFNFKHGKYCGKHYCIDCKKEISSRNDSKRCHSCENKRKYKEGILNNKGSNSGRWLNGLSREPYSFEFDDILKEEIRKRDNYICQNCSITEEEHLIVFGKVLHIHHIDYNKKNCKEDNLITVCNNCNLRANSNRDYWKIYYKEKICLNV
jgi:hypothetical protein